jgi:hypothetical protein
MRPLFIVMALVLAMPFAAASSLAHVGAFEHTASERHADYERVASGCCHAPDDSSSASAPHAHSCSSGCAVLAVMPTVPAADTGGARLSVTPRQYMSPALDRPHRPPLPRS